jgi:hypothetical protein
VDLSTIKAGDDLFITEPLLSGGGWSNSWRYHHSSFKKQHEIWSHGNELLLKVTPSQEDFAAALIQFQRAVELRDKLLDKLYGFENIPGKRSTVKYAVMADLGIIRPTLKIRLRDLRNKLMHDPEVIHMTADECNLLADTAWYYLKVTDRIAEQCADEVYYDLTSNDTDKSGLTAKIEPVSWTVNLNGYLAHNHILESAVVNSPVIQVHRCEYARYNNSLNVWGVLTGPPATVWSVVQNFFDESIL